MLTEEEAEVKEEEATADVSVYVSLLYVTTRKLVDVVMPCNVMNPVRANCAVANMQ